MALRAIVAGGGIGGLAAALALRQAGAEVTVLERGARQERETELQRGAGLTIWPNGVLVLRALGAEPFLPAIAVPFRRVRFRSWQGEEMGEQDAAGFPRRYGAPVMPLHRADLYAALLRAVGPQSVTFGAPVEAFEQSAAGVTVRAGGREFAGDILVGADGINSVIRAHLLGDGPPAYTGYSGWRGVAPRAPEGMAPGEGTNMWGPGAEFGWMPIVDGRVYWYGTQKVPLGEGAERATTPAEDKRAVIERFGGWSGPGRALIASTPESTISRLGIFYRPPVDRWGEGRVTLLGDAAHAMTPQMGQGANQALEDAYVLGQVAAEIADPEAMLRAYEQRRLGRANTMVRLSLQEGAMIHVENPFLRTLRNVGMKLMLPVTRWRRTDLLLRGPVDPRTLAPATR